MYIVARQGSFLTEHGFFSDDLFTADIGEFTTITKILNFKTITTSTNDTMIVAITLRELYKDCFKVADKPAIAFVSKCGFMSTPIGIIRNQCPPFMTIDEAKVFFTHKEQGNETTNPTIAP